MRLTKEIVKKAIRETLKENYDDFEANNKYGPAPRSLKSKIDDLLDELETEIYSIIPPGYAGERSDDDGDFPIFHILEQLRDIIGRLQEPNSGIGTRGERS